MRAFSSERRFLDDLHSKVDLATKVREILTKRYTFPVLRRLQMWYCAYFTD